MKLAKRSSPFLPITSRIQPFPNPVLTTPFRNFAFSNKYQSSIFVDPEDNTIDLDDDAVVKESAYRGQLVIVPTPLGNLGDLSLRQYEALTSGCDIIACEDTRKTGKMLQLMRDKRIKGKFFHEFGVDMDAWRYDDGDSEFGQNLNKAKKANQFGENMQDVDKNEFADQDPEIENAEYTIDQELKSEFNEQAASKADDQNETHHFLSEEEFADQRLLNRLNETNEQIDEIMQQPAQTEEDALRLQVQEILQRFEQEVEKNKFGDLEANIRKERDTALEKSMTAEDKEFVEMIDQEYYKRVKTSDEFYRRKKLILKNLEKLQKKVESSAKNFDDYSKLKFIMLEKAKQKQSVLKNFYKLESFRQPNSQNYKFFEEDDENFNTFTGDSNSNQEDDFDQFIGIESDFTREMKEKIDKLKVEKGRGLLLSFYEFNQELRIPKLIRAMKMGLKVALVCDAGTPTISDPGFKFVQEAKNSGLTVEALPGPCAVTTALSASGFPADKFMFMGYLSKTQSEREDTLIEILRSGLTCGLYESPQRLVRSLYAIEEIFGPTHQVYVGMELTKRYEQHICDTVIRVRQHLEQAFEGRRVKGEVTMIIAPWVDEEMEEQKDIQRGAYFDAKRDAVVKTNILTLAERLHGEVEMHDSEFRDLLKKLFPELPTAHIHSVVRTVKQGKKPKRFGVILDRVGGVL